MLSLRDKIRVALQNARRAGDSYAASRLEKALQPMGMAQAPNLREYVPTPSNVPQPQIDPRLSPLDQAEQLSMGLGTGVVNQLEGAKQLVTDPIGSAKALYEGGREIVRNPALLGEMAQDIYGRATSGPMGFGEVVGEFVNPLRVRSRPVMREIDVYHGSPHRFEEFDASKIGTGEGAQAYGHGIYLAENPKVAMEYQKLEPTVLVPPRRTFKGVELEPGSPEYQAARIVDEVGLNKGRKQVQSWIESADPRMTREVEGWRRTLQVLNEATDKKDFKSLKNQGNLYTADLPDEMVDRMLDWDKPLSEQPALLKAAQKLNDNYLRWDEPVETATGRDLYEALEAQIGSKEASAVMKELNIPGIQYLDAGSRGQGGGGTRNFVVFPGEEKKVKILKKDGQKLSAVDGNRFPVVKAGDVVDGLKVRPEAANVSSIKASLENYSVMPGIRSVSIDDFGEPGPLTGKVDKLDKRTRELADAISQSNEITPLIVVYSGSQNYILEGSHRIDALDALGKKKIPVIAVIDEDDPPAFWKGRR